MKYGDYTEISNTIKSMIFWTVMTFCICMLIIFLFFFHHETYVALSQEDSFFENMTAIFYFIAGSIMIYRYIYDSKKSNKYIQYILPLLLGILFVFIAGEEISWGQRIFNYEITDRIKTVNVQREYTIHNLYLFKDSLILDQHKILNIFTILNGILFPILYFFHKKIRNLFNRINFPIIPISCCSIFIFSIAFEIIISKVSPDWIHAEVKEFMFSIGYIMFSISYLFNKNRLCL